MWNSIEYKGFPFIVCDDGTVKIAERTITYADGRTYTYPERVVRKNLDRAGYEVFSISAAQPRRTVNFKVHQLVALAFPDICGDWFEGAVVNHKDENKGNNRADNLEWVTDNYNRNYGTGILRARQKKFNKGSKMMPEKAVVQMTKDGEVIREYPSIREATRETGIEHSCISRCCSGSRNAKTAGGYKWSFL